jgi:hypothetical protein
MPGKDWRRERRERCMGGGPRSVGEVEFVEIEEDAAGVSEPVGFGVCGGGGEFVGGGVALERAAEGFADFVGEGAGECVERGGEV